jgi:hypothetical protein
MPKSHHSSSSKRERSQAAPSSPSSRSHHSSQSKRDRSQAGPSSPSSTAITIKSSQTEDSTYLSAKERVEQIHERTNRHDDEELAQKRKLVPRLAKRAYHLEEGNTWCQDWVQYQKNTHPVFGLCMYHRFHPIRLPQRVIILVGSIAFGFAITNCVYLGFLQDGNAGSAVTYAYDKSGELAQLTSKYTNVQLETSMIFLLTVGSFLHSAFDMSIWYLMACFCFRPGGYCQKKGGGWSRSSALCQTFGIYAAVLVVIVAVVSATFVAVVRLTQDEEIMSEKSASFTEELVGEQLGDDSSGPPSKMAFLVGYVLELFVAFFVFYFFTSTVFFSGILGCGRIPVLGGRPYELRKEKMKKMKREQSADNGEEEEEEEDTHGMMAYDV